MNTTAAATQANVTAATIRTWCRKGVIAATKQAGRWNIDPASLARRIEIGARMSSPSTRYTVTEGTNQYGTTTYTVTRTDGTPAGYGPDKDSAITDFVFLKEEQAETGAAILNALPSGYYVRKHEVRYHRSSINQNHWVWRLAGGDANDPQDVRGDRPLDANKDEAVEYLVRCATQHAAGTADRIAKKAEQDAINAAEATVRAAREAQLAEAHRTKGPLATPRQVDFILQLLARRERTGEGGGFFYGPTDRAGIEEMSKADASTYITSLKGDY
ncbi:helix-turn-helix domain-containing protein [Streptomyces albogriseolus]